MSTGRVEDFAGSAGRRASNQAVESRVREYRLLRFIGRRLLLMPIVLLGVIAAVFVMIDLSPNNPAYAALGPFADAEARARFAAEHGLNDALPVRFVRFLGDLVHLNLGQSVVRPESVDTLIARALPVTFQLMLVSILMAVVASLVLGVVAARTEGRFPDRIIGGVAAFFQAAPQFWVGMVFVQFVAIRLHIVPAGGYQPLSAGFPYWFSSIVGPSLVMALPLAAGLTRIVRASVAAELAKDYVRTAVGAGVSWPQIILRNVLRNAMMTPITVLGVYIGALMSGAVLVETVFNVPGMGALLVTGVTQDDLGVVRGVATVGAISFVVVNLLVDCAYLFLSPRIAGEGSR